MLTSTLLHLYQAIIFVLSHYSRARLSGFQGDVATDNDALASCVSTDGTAIQPSVIFKGACKK